MSAGYVFALVDISMGAKQYNMSGMWTWESVVQNESQPCYLTTAAFYLLRYRLGKSVQRAEDST